MKPFFVNILGILCLFSCSQTKHDLLITNGLVYDGLGDAPFVADIAVDNGKISAIGDLEDHTAHTTIDALNKAVSPGFIDMHTHLDPILRMPDAESHDIYMQKYERYTELCDVMKDPWDHMYETVSEIKK